GVFRVVVVLFGFDAWIGEVVNFDFQSEFSRRRLHHVSKLKDRKLLRKLIEHTTFTPCRRLKTGEFDAANRVPDIQKTAGLTALAVDSKRMANGRLHTETV